MARKRDKFTVDGVEYEGYQYDGNSGTALFLEIAQLVTKPALMLMGVMGGDIANGIPEVQITPEFMASLGETVVTTISPTILMPLITRILKGTTRVTDKGTLENLNMQEDFAGDPFKLFSLAFGVLEFQYDNFLERLVSFIRTVKTRIQSAFNRLAPPKKEPETDNPEDSAPQI